MMEILGFCYLYISGRYEKGGGEIFSGLRFSLIFVDFSFLCGVFVFVVVVVCLLLVLNVEVRFRRKAGTGAKGRYINREMDRAR